MKPLYVFLAVLATTATANADNSTAYIREFAGKYRISSTFALRVAKVESNYKCSAVGRAGEVGPLQILPSTARSLGYKNIRGASCRTKVDAGMKHLAICYHGANGNARRAAACHNAGVASLKWRRYPAAVQRYVRRVGY